jgi:hypothetical protein
MSEAAQEAKTNGIPTPEELGFDPAGLRQKYAAERAKRLRTSIGRSPARLSITTRTRTSNRASPARR